MAIHIVDCWLDAAVLRYAVPQRRGAGISPIREPGRDPNADLELACAETDIVQADPGFHAKYSGPQSRGAKLSVGGPTRLKVCYSGHVE